MSKQEAHVPVFPTTTEHGFNSGMPGMDLRDYFAAKAMQGFFSVEQPTTGVLKKHNCKSVPEFYAFAAYAYADAMMKARDS